MSEIGIFNLTPLEVMKKLYDNKLIIWNDHKRQYDLEKSFEKKISIAILCSIPKTHNFELGISLCLERIGKVLKKEYDELTDNEIGVGAKLIADIINLEEEVKTLLSLRYMLADLISKYNDKPNLFLNAIIRNEGLEDKEKICREVFEKLEKMGIIGLSNNEPYISSHYLGSFYKTFKLPYDFIILRSETLQYALVGYTIEKLITDYDFGRMESIIGSYIMDAIVVAKLHNILEKDKEYEKIYG